MSQPSEAGDAAALDARYGRRPDARPTGKLVVVLLTLGLLAWAVWAAFGQSSDRPTAVVRSFEVTSPHQMSVTVDITRVSRASVRCTVTALASDHSAVGQTLVTVPAGAAGTRSVVTVVRTEREATSADVGSCD